VALSTNQGHPTLEGWDTRRESNLQGSTKGIPSRDALGLHGIGQGSQRSRQTISTFCHPIQLSEAGDETMPLLDIVKQALAFSVESLQWRTSPAHSVQNPRGTRRMSSTYGGESTSSSTLLRPSSRITFRDDPDRSSPRTGSMTGSYP
jgi:hypothetical protein